MSQLQTQGEKIKNIRGLLEKLKPQIALAIPHHMSPDRMARIAMTAILRNPRLLDCTPESLAGAIIQCSQLGLEPDDVRGEAYLVPFRNNRKNTYEVQLIPGYKGLMNLARRSKEITIIDADVVYEADKFDFRKGTDAYLHHVPTNGEWGAPVWVYSLAKFKNGDVQFHVMSIPEVNAARERSRAKDSGPWITDWEEMAKKSTLRRLCKYLPSSVELATAVALDERAEAGIPQDLDLMVVPESGGGDAGGPEAKIKSSLDALAEKMKAEAAAPAPEAKPADEAQAGRRESEKPRPPEEILIEEIRAMSEEEFSGLDSRLGKIIKQRGIKGNGVMMVIDVLNERKKGIA